MKKGILGFIVLTSLSACYSAPPPPPEIIKHVPVQAGAVPGTVNGVWVEPMYDTVKTPGQLDPEGNYYRLPSETVVEVYPDRYQPVEYPPNSIQENNRERVRRFR